MEISFHFYSSHYSNPFNLTLICKIIKKTNKINECNQIFSATNSFDGNTTFENSWKLIELPLQFLYAHKEVMRPPFLSSPHKNCLWIYYGNSRRKARSVEPRLPQMSGSTMRNPTSCPTSRALLRIVVESSVVTSKVRCKWHFVASFRYINGYAS